MPDGSQVFGKWEALSLILSRSFIWCAALTVVAGSGMVFGARRIVASDRAERRSYEAVGRLEEARASLRSAVSEMRGYMLTAETTHQQVCLSDLDNVIEELNQFSEVSGRIQAVESIRRSVAETQSAMSAAMAARSDSGAVVAARLASDPILTNLIVRVENGIGEQLTSQSNQIGVHREKRQDDFLLSEIAFLGTMLFGTVAIVLAWLSLKREGQQRRIAETQHANAKQDLLTAQAMLEFSNQKDELSGLLNRDAFTQIFEQEFDKNRQSRLAISLVIVQLDQLSEIREVRGVDTYEEVVRQASSIIKESFRGGDVCCRYSDSEFAIVMPRTSLQSASVAAERARTLIEQAEWPDCNITASFGVAQADFLKNRAELVARAEQAVDYARRTGHNRVTAIRAYLPMSA